MKESIIKRIKDFRYERKFPLEDISCNEIFQIIKKHPAGFREIYYERNVNSIYFDTFNLNHYFESRDGVNSRLKVRIRWYSKLFDNIQTPFIEFKYRQSDQIGKLQYPLRSFELGPNFSIHTIREVFKESRLDESVYQYLATLNLSALTSYQRKYFLSFDRRYRITLDRYLTTYKLSNNQNSFLNHSKNDRHLILELKYDTPCDDHADEIANVFTFRMCKSSKYLIAIEN